jgi:hypothetical protein
VNDHDGGIPAPFAEALRQVDVPGHGDGVVLERDAPDGDVTDPRGRSGVLGVGSSAAEARPGIRSPADTMEPPTNR